MQLIRDMARERDWRWMNKEKYSSISWENYFEMNLKMNYLPTSCCYDSRRAWLSENFSEGYPLSRRANYLSPSSGCIHKWSHDMGNSITWTHSSCSISQNAQTYVANKTREIKLLVTSSCLLHSTQMCLLVSTSFTRKRHQKYKLELLELYIKTTWLECFLHSKSFTCIKLT